MTNLERIEFLTNKLHNLLSQTQELKEMIEIYDAQNKATPSSEEESGSLEEDNSNTEVIEQKPEPRTWCCCFTRKPKLN
jgi:hypothetical protein